MKIILTDINGNLIEEWNKCKLPEGTEVYKGSIFDNPVDALVSPANSFGFMDGGIDLEYSRAFGWLLQNEVQYTISEEYDGELLIGQAFKVPTNNEKFKYLIVSPTMRVPMIIADPTSVRLATRAAMKVALKSKFESVAFPGMGTGTGMVKPDWAAKMMIAGIEDALNPPKFPLSLGEAVEDHYKTYPKDE